MRASPKETSRLSDDGRPQGLTIGAEKDEGQRCGDDHRQSEAEEGRADSARFDHELRQGHDDGAADGADGARRSHHRRPAFRRGGTPNCRQHRAVARAAETNTDQHARADHGRPKARHCCGQGKAQRIRDGARDNDRCGAVPIGNRARNRLRQSPDEIVERNRQREHRERQAPFHRGRPQDEAVALANAHRDRHDHRTARRSSGTHRAILVKSLCAPTRGSTEVSPPIIANKRKPVTPRER